MSFKILYLEKEEADYLALKRLLHAVFEKFELVWVKNKQDFEKKISVQFEPNVVIMDYVFNGYNAIEIIPLVRLKFSFAPIILLTAFDGPGIETELKQYGLEEVFRKNDLMALGMYLAQKSGLNQVFLPGNSDFGKSKVDAKFKIIQEALKLAKNRNFLNPLISFHSQPVMMINSKLEVVMVNEMGREFFQEILKINFDVNPVKINENAIDKNWIDLFRKGFKSNVSLELKWKDTPFQLFINHQNNQDGTSFLIVMAVAWSRVNSLLHHTTYSEKLKDLFDTEASIVVQFDLLGKIQFVSANVFNVLGFSASELIGRDIESLNAGIFENNFVINEFQKIKAEPNFLRSGKGEMRKKDLTFIQVFYRAKGVLDFAGKLQGIMCVFRDITQHVELNNRLALSESKLNAIISSIDDIILEINQDLLIDSIWTQNESLLFLPKYELYKKHIEWLASQFNLPQISEYVKLVFQDGISRNLEYHSPLNKASWLYAKINKVKSDVSQFVCIVISDISIKKKAEAEIKLNLAKEKELAELKTMFIAMTSHEFRTPLASISSSSELLGLMAESLDISPDHKIWRYISNIQFGVNRMVNLIDDVLFLGKIESGKMQVEKKELMLSVAIKEILENLTQIGRIPQMPNFSVSGTEYTIHADLRILEHIVENLIVNAYKYTQNGTIPLIEIEAKQHRVVLKVIDYGIGIPENEQGKLFSQYFRASNVLQIPGTGLGLSITKKLLDLMNCPIEVTSTLNMGTTMKITFAI